MFKSIRMLLAITAFHDYEIWRMDVKIAFLNGNLEEDVYMIQPTGFEDPKILGRYASFSNPFMD
jgi:Reverse transcriptase (RNA-dependent DNA polymerase)